MTSVLEFEIQRRRREALRVWPHTISDDLADWLIGTFDDALDVLSEHTATFDQVTRSLLCDRCVEYYWPCPDVKRLIRRYLGRRPSDTNWPGLTP